MTHAKHPHVYKMAGGSSFCGGKGLSAGSPSLQSAPGPGWDLADNQHTQPGLWSGPRAQLTSLTQQLILRAPFRNLLKQCRGSTPQLLAQSPVTISEGRRIKKKSKKVKLTIIVMKRREESNPREGSDALHSCSPPSLAPGSEHCFLASSSQFTHWSCGRECPSGQLSSVYSSCSLCTSSLAELGKLRGSTGKKINLIPTEPIRII